MLIWYFSNNNDIYDYFGKLQEQHFTPWPAVLINAVIKFLQLLKFVYFLKIYSLNIISSPARFTPTVHKTSFSWLSIKFHLGMLLTCGSLIDCKRKTLKNYPLNFPIWAKRVIFILQYQTEEALENLIIYL